MEELKNLAYGLLTYAEYSDFIDNVKNKKWSSIYLTAYEAYDQAKKRLISLASGDKCDMNAIKDFKTAHDFREKATELLVKKGYELKTFSVR